MMLRAVIVGAAVAVMAGAVGLDSFSVEWWLFLIAGNVMASYPEK